MAKTIQVRGVPDALHATLKRMAAREGLSLSAFVRRELERMAGSPTRGDLREWLERTRKPKPVGGGIDVVKFIREMRGD